MTVHDVQTMLERWAPRGAAWERDNVGLQVGDSARGVKKILVALDVSDAVVDEARKKEVDLIVSHHPLLFRPPRSVTPHDRVGRIIIALVRHNIALYAMHTNLDFAMGGISFALAERLGIRDATFLEKQSGLLRKVAVFAPAEHVDVVATAMAEAGGGVIGKYEHCSFRIEGIGTFRGISDAKPFLGKAGRLERVSEIRLEMVVPAWRVGEVVKAMRETHPYEEVAYDVYVLENPSANVGAGVIGNLPRAVTLAEFLRMVKRRLGTPMLRYAGDVRRRIRRVAVCGGSGAEFVDAAIRNGAEAYVTADVKYHAFEAVDNAIAIIDAGHFETESPAIPTIVRYLRDQPAVKAERVQVLPSSINTNYVRYS